MAVTQSLTITRGSLGLADLVITNDPAATDYTIPEGGLAFPDFDMRVTYNPDGDDVPGSVLQSYALGVGSMPGSIDVKGSTLAELQTNRRALEAAVAQAGETVTLGIGTETETYPMFPSWPKWGAVNSGGLNLRIITATLALPVNPMTTPDSSSSSSSSS